MGNGWVYPPHVQSLPPFSHWLRSHVIALRQDRFPIPQTVVQLSCPPSKVSTSYKHMWAYGAHYRVEGEDQGSHGTFDSGVAIFPSDNDSSGPDVGTVQKIYLVSFSGFNVVLMKVSWIKKQDQGRRTIRQDALGFLTVLYGCREDPEHDNPFVFPSSVSQVFFVEDGGNREWKIVIKHEPRSRRVVYSSDTDFVVAMDAELPLEAALPTIWQDSAVGSENFREVNASEVLQIATDTAHAMVDFQYEDDQYLDEAEL